MPSAIPFSTRQEIIQRVEAGQSLTQIAQALNRSYWSVRQVWRSYRDQGDTGLQLGYSRCGRQGYRSPDLIYRCARYLRYRHRAWGAGLIRVILVNRYAAYPIPSVRTLQRWFKAAGLGPPPRRRPRQRGQRAQRVHEVWQMDAKERVGLKNGQQVSWITLADEKSGAILSTPVFPPRSLSPSAT